MIPVEIFAKETDLNQETDRFNKQNYTKIDLEDFQARAEEIKDYNLAYQELLKEEYKKQIQNAIEGKNCVNGFEFLHSFENHLMANYRFWDVVHNDEVSKLEPWGGKTRNELLNMMKDVLESTPTNKMAMASADLKNGKINIDTMLNFTRANSAEDVSKENAQTMVSYAKALEERNKSRSFWGMIRNLGTHFKEKRAIKEMITAAAKSGESLYELERLAHKNPDYVEIEKSDLVITRAPKQEPERISINIDDPEKNKALAKELGKEAIKTYEKTMANNTPKSRK